MDPFRLLLAAGLALTAVWALAQLAWAYAQMPTLADVPAEPLLPGDAARSPRVSIVVAARDEERHIAAAVGALLALDYPDYELIVVDDRSQDRTPAILTELASANSRLQVVRVDQLPDGWLGKNHALDSGARRATGDLLLFTDADVLLEADALGRAVRLMRIENAEHLAVAPDLVLPTWPLALAVNYFMMWFLLWLRPWRARNPRSDAFIGIGAFNLVKAEAYRAVGGHTKIALRPDDDIMLGKLLKRAGHAQLLASGLRVIRVEWYRNLGEMVRGLRKNTFAGLGYSAWLAGGAIAVTLLLGVWPFIAVWLTDGTEALLYGTAAAAQVIGYAGPAVVQRSRAWLAFLYPAAALVFAWIMAAAVVRTLLRGGIEWRGTFYKLDDLRANRVES